MIIVATQIPSPQPLLTALSMHLKLIGKVVQFKKEQQCTYAVGQERKFLCEIKFLVYQRNNKITD